MMSRSHFGRLVVASMISSFTFAAGLTAAIPAQAQTFGVVWDAPGSPGPSIIDGVMLARDGNLYGSSYYGGSNSNGTIYGVTPEGVGSVIVNIPTNVDDCYYTPQILGTDGNLYGVGTGCYLNADNDSVIEATTSGGFTILQTFSGTDGISPSLAFQGSNGELYGTTYSGGANSGGTFFEITTSGTVKTLVSFGNDANGVEYPTAILLGTDGDYYGTAWAGVGDCSGGCVFKLTPSGKLTILHGFTGDPDGSNPASLVQGSDGNLYGVTQYGGTNNEGTIFKVTTSGKETILHNVDYSTDDGDYPGPSLTEGSDGNFYSTMASCNVFGCSPNQNVYEITPKGVFTVLGVFNGTNGTGPFYGVVQHPDGNFYGVTNSGGAYNEGTLFSVNNGLSPFAKLYATSGKEGSVVGILGQGFSSSSVVEFGGVAVTTISLSGTTFINATVPAGGLTGSVSVITGSTTLKSWQTFDVIPTLTTFSPTSGPVGTDVTITGTALTQATKVTFDGKSASFTVNSDTEITATVPTGATTGKIKVTTKGGSVTSSGKFTVD